jgi:hypothetical protein
MWTSHDGTPEHSIIKIVRIVSELMTRNMPNQDTRQPAAANRIASYQWFGSNGTENKRNHGLEFALLVMNCRLLNFDYQKGFIAPL